MPCPLPTLPLPAAWGDGTGHEPTQVGQGPERAPTCDMMSVGPTVSAGAQVLGAFTSEHRHSSESGGSQGYELLAEGVMPAGGSSHGPGSPRGVSGVTSAWRHRGHAAVPSRWASLTCLHASVTPPLRSVPCGACRFWLDFHVGFGCVG